MRAGFCLDEWGVFSHSVVIYFSGVEAVWVFFWFLFELLLWIRVI